MYKYIHKYYIGYVLLSQLFISCDNSSIKTNDPIFMDEINSSETVIKFTPPTSWGTSSEYENIVDTMEFIYLETNDSVLISTIDDIKFVNDKIFIFDYKVNQVVIFNKKGKAIKTIKNRGHASNEYLRLCGFDIDTQKELIYLLDGDNGKILSYNFSGEQIGIHLLPYRYISHMIYQGDGKFLFEFGTRESSRKKISPNMALYNIESTKIDSTYFHYKNDDIFYFLSNQKTFSSYQNEIYYWVPLGHSIYQFSGDSVQKIVDFDFKDKNVPYSIYRYKWREASQIMKTNEYLYINWFCNFNDWYYFRITKSSSILHCFYHKESKEIFIDNSFFNFDHFPKIISQSIFKVSDTEFCGHVPPEVYLHYIKDDKNVKLEDNPVLMLYKLRN